MALAAVGCTHTVTVYVAAKPSTALVDLQAVLSAGSQQGLTGTVSDQAATGSGPGGSTPIAIPITGDSISSTTKVRLVLLARNSCTSPVDYAQISLFFNTTGADSRIHLQDPPNGTHDYHMRDRTGDAGVLLRNQGASKLLVDTVGSVGKCQSFRQLGTFTSK